MRSNCASCFSAMSGRSAGGKYGDNTQLLYMAYRYGIVLLFILLASVYVVLTSVLSGRLTHVVGGQS